jgi:hypothetical protein
MDGVFKHIVLFYFKITPKTTKWIYAVRSTASITISSISIQLSLSLAQQPNASQGRLILDVSISHTTEHHSGYDSSVWWISPWQKPLLTTHNTHRTHTCMPLAGFETTIPARGSRPSPQAARLPESASISITGVISRISLLLLIIHILGLCVYTYNYDIITS